MTSWSDTAINSLLDRAELALSECIENLHLPALVLRKERAVGIIPSSPNIKLPRESLEEIVLAVSKVLESSPERAASATIPFCAFNGGNDVFVDIGDKSWGVRACQKFFADQDGRAVDAKRTIHVGDQFLSASGTNDFMARTVGTTAWVASPAETVMLLDELREFGGVVMAGKRWAGGVGVNGHGNGNVGKRGSLSSVGGNCGPAVLASNSLFSFAN
jgi:IMP and pyridine-specific 5'-nucleotidase